MFWSFGNIFRGICFRIATDLSIIVYTVVTIKWVKIVDF